MTFDDDFQPTCTCAAVSMTPDDYLENVAPPETNDLEGVGVWIEQLNQAFNMTNVSESSTCVNGCSSCVEQGFCGVFEYSTSFSLQGRLSQPFTLLDLMDLGDANDTEAVAFLLSRVLVSVQASEASCLDLTSGEAGKVCSRIDLDLPQDNDLDLIEFDDTVFVNNATATCMVTLDDTACASCEIDLDTECIQVNCTNLLPDAVMDSCGADPAEGFVGPLEAFYYLEVADNNVTGNVTVGNCFTESPTLSPNMMTVSPTTSEPTSMPTMVPVSPTTEDPRSVPSSSPPCHSLMMFFSVSVVATLTHLAWN